MKRYVRPVAGVVILAILAFPLLVNAHPAQQTAIGQLWDAIAGLDARVAALEAAHASPVPSPTPSVAPSLTASPTVAPTPVPTPTASPGPSPTPTPLPTPTPTVAPTPTPTPTPSVACGVPDLRAAITAATAGAVIKISGTHTLTSIIRTSKSLTIEACPGGATITGPSNVRQDYIYFTGGPNTVRGVTFVSGSGIFHDSMGSALLECEGCNNLLVEGVTFVGHLNLDDHQQLFYQRLGRNVTVRGSTFIANGTEGFGVHQYPGSSTDPITVIEDSQFSGFSVSAAITTDSRITIRRNNFTDMRAAIQLRNFASGSVVTDNTGTNVADPYDNTAVPFTQSGNVWN